MKSLTIKIATIVILLACLTACENASKQSQSKEETAFDERPASWYGDWKTTWKTTPEDDESLSVFTDYETNGMISFRENDVTVTINGFPGCIFGPDTLSHTQQWKVNGNEQLQFFTAPDTIGITYAILSLSDQKIELRLLEDIFLTLEK